MRRTYMLLALCCSVAIVLAGCAPNASKPAVDTSPLTSGSEATETTAPASDSQPTSESPAATSDAAAPNTGPGKSPATMEKYNQIQNGMDLAAVVKVMGEPHTKIGESTSGDITVAMYGWYGKDLATAVSVSFLNGKVNKKAQIGLE